MQERRFNVDLMSWHWLNVESTFQRYVPAGINAMLRRCSYVDATLYKRHLPAGCIFYWNPLNLKVNECPDQGLLFSSLYYTEFIDVLSRQRRPWTDIADWSANSLPVYGISVIFSRRLWYQDNPCSFCMNKYNATLLFQGTGNKLWQDKPGVVILCKATCDW